jgi:hypothetical protein
MSTLLDTMIPGDVDFPAASAVGLHDALVAHDRFAAPYKQILALLPDAFDKGSQESREGTLTEIEVLHSDLFNGLTVGAYSLYYTHPQVAAVIESLTGHTARAPQPAGHSLAPFDLALVAIPAARAPLYRPTPEIDNA